MIYMWQGFIQTFHYVDANPRNANHLPVNTVFPLQDRTNNLFKQVYEQKSLKGRANDAIASACLYIACRQEGVPRTFKGQNKLFQLLELSAILLVTTALCK